MMGWIRRQLNQLPKSRAFWLVVAGLILSGLGMYFGWDWLRSGATENEPNSTTIRNAGIVIAGIFALVFALWRGLVAERQAAASQSQAETAERQAETALRQTETAQRQVDTAQQGLLNERYQKGADMLGSGVLAVRLGGIYALQRLAEEHPEQYHVQVMRLLCAFVRHPAEVEEQPTVGSSEVKLGSVYGATTAQDFAASGALEIEVVVREDIQAAMDSIASCHTRNPHIETLHNYWIDLHDADLRGVDLSNKDLSRAPEYDEAAPFDYAMIGTMHTNLRGGKLHYANLARTNLTRTDLSHASGLTQSILDDAYADPRMPPRLDYTFDAETGKALVWCLKPIDAGP